MTPRTLAVVLAALALAAAAADAPARLVIVNARVADLAAGRTYPVAAVIVEGATIAAVHTKMPESMPEPATRIDAGGATLVPALADLAVQALPGAALDVDFFYAMSLAHGVMRLRVVDVRLPWGVEQRERVARGEVPGPQLWTSGPILDMRSAFGSRTKPVLAGGLTPFVQVADPVGLGREVTRQAARGVDWVRLGSNVPPDGVRSAMVEGRKGKVRVSVATGATAMLQAAQAGVHLLDGLGAPMKPLGEQGPAGPNGAKSAQATTGQGQVPQPPSQPGSESIEAMWSRLTQAEQRSLVAQLVRGKVAVAPMLAIEHWRSGERQNLAADIEYLPKNLRTSRESEPSPPGTEALRASLERKKRLVMAMAAAGVPIVTASGSSLEGWPVPGVGVLREIALLVEAGLTPVQALRAATVAGAELLGDRKGARIMSGAQADFVGVRGDPLAGVAALADVTLIVRGGQVQDRAALLALARKASSR
jgi:hypothetical protein